MKNAIISWSGPDAFEMLLNRILSKRKGKDLSFTPDYRLSWFDGVLNGNISRLSTGNHKNRGSGETSKTKGFSVCRQRARCNVPALK